MKTFKDAKGRNWNLALTIGRARIVLARTGVDLLQPELAKPTLPEVLTDEFKVAEIVEAMLDGQFQTAGVNPDSMLTEDWDGATSRAAYDALLGELASFFEARGQTGRAEIVRKTAAAIQSAMEVNGARIAALDPAAEIRRAAGNTSGRPQDASGSTPVL